MIVRGRDTTEEEIEELLVSNFGKKLSEEEMKDVIVIKVAPPDIPLIRGNGGCSQHESVDIQQGHFKVQGPSPYYK
jgi:hypothetical protein